MQFVEQNENANTRQKTLSHQKLFEQFLVSQNEVRQIHNIPPSDLDKYISKFLLSVRQKNGQEYEPVTLRSMFSSFERYLKRHNYGTSLISGYEFDTSRKVLKSKQKDLKKNKDWATSQKLRMPSVTTTLTYFMNVDNLESIPQRVF